MLGAGLHMIMLPTYHQRTLRYAMAVRPAISCPAHSLLRTPKRIFPGNLAERKPYTIIAHVAEANQQRCQGTLRRLSHPRHSRY